MSENKDKRNIKAWLLFGIFVLGSIAALVLAIPFNKDVKWYGGDGTDGAITFDEDFTADGTTWSGGLVHFENFVLDSGTWPDIGFSATAGDPVQITSAVLNQVIRFTVTGTGESTTKVYVGAIATALVDVQGEDSFTYSNNTVTVTATGTANIIITLDRFEFVSITTGDSRVDVGGTFELRYKIRYDYSDVTFDDSKGSITGFVWDTTNNWWDKTVTASSSVVSTNYDETYIIITDDIYSLTAKEDVAGVNVVSDRWKILSLTSSQDPSLLLGTEVFYYIGAELEYDNHACGLGDTLSVNDIVFTWDGSYFVSTSQKFDEATVLILNTITASSETTYGITTTSNSNFNDKEYTTTWGTVSSPGSGSSGGSSSASSTITDTPIVTEGGKIVIGQKQPFDMSRIFGDLGLFAVQNAPIIVISGTASIFLLPSIVEDKNEDKIKKLKTKRAYRKQKAENKDKKVGKRKKKKAKEFV
jgi:hypothetical protein